MALSDAELRSIAIRLDAATSVWPPSGAALQELVQLAREDLPVVLAELRDHRARLARAGEDGEAAPRDLYP